jgi:hypothetical protein
MQVGAAKSIYIRARSPRTTIVPDLIPDQHPHNTLRSYQSFLFFLAIMSLSANFVGNNNVNNKLGPMVKDNVLDKRVSQTSEWVKNLNPLYYLDDKIASIHSIDYNYSLYSSPEA